MRSRMLWAGALLLILAAGFVLGSQKMTVAENSYGNNSGNASNNARVAGNGTTNENYSYLGWVFENTNNGGNASVLWNISMGNNTSDARPKLFYFYRKGCSACAEVTPWVENEMKNYASSIELVEHDIDEGGGWSIHKGFCSAYGVPVNETFVPMVFIGNAYLWGVDGIMSGLDGAIETCLDEKCETPSGLPE